MNGHQQTTQTLPALNQQAQPSLAKWLPLTQQAIEGRPVNTVNARELHAFLTVGRDFSTWMKERITEYGFHEGADYVLIPQIRGTKQGRGGDRRSKEYALSLDMAKELAMVERTDEGRRARRYFIDCENLLIAVAPELNQVAVERWHGEREASKDYCKLMNDSLEGHRLRLGKATLGHHYSNEANLINRLVLGMDAAKWAKAHGVSVPIRQHMNAYQLSLVAYLERSNATLLDAGMPFNERKERLLEMLATKVKREAQQ
ncbi:antA/AntB antirepressor family protein [Aeromonas rivuli]|uniref:antA/AntB antirepressor family protein n=1 Tax=Aeromonas rivuli TaxID=648794 RepID=UPI0005AA50C2|nr:antA/AntB antirepressor family protein [Aeromonas rivuli]